MFSRSIPILLVALFFSGVASASFHDFESADGRTIRAEILRFTDSGAVIVREDGQRFDIKSEMLSSRSQKLLSSLKRAYDLSRIDQVHISVSTNRESKNVQNYEGSSREVSHYEKRVRFRRPRDLSLDGLVVKYMIFIERDSDEDHEDVVTGEYSIREEDPGGDYTFKTVQYNLNREYLHAGYWWHRERNEYEDDDLGIWLKIYDGNNEVMEYSNPRSLQTKREWRHSSSRKRR
ncbi:MAG: hypothetical protein ACPGN3_09250 [Opitutales bacterium]